MLRLDDWQCLDCGETGEYLTRKGEPKEQELECKHCCREGETAQMQRQLSAPARYLGKRIRAYYSPKIHGGKYDTMGYVAPPALPDLPGAAEADAEYTKALDKAKTVEDMRQAHHDCVKDAPTPADYREFHKKPEFQEIKKEHDKVIKENQEKRARADSGASVREKPCAGDAKELHR